MGVNLNAVEHPTWERVAPSTVRDLTSPWEIPEPTEVACPQCGNRYSTGGIGTHWVRSSECRHPPLTEKQRDLVTGLLMSDGCLNRQQGKNPFLRVGMITPRYLQHLDRSFDVLGNDVRMKQTATEKARESRNTGFRLNAAAKDYHDVFVWRTRSLPELKEFDWYGEDGKVWPSDIELSPTVLRTLYVADGNWDNCRANDRIRIALSNEVEHQGKVDSMFRRAGLPTPSNYATCERRRDGSVKCDAYFTVEDSYELFRYMQPAPPGFEYKFPEQFHDAEPAETPVEPAEPSTPVEPAEPSTPVETVDARTETTDESVDGVGSGADSPVAPQSDEARGLWGRTRDWLGGVLR